MLEKLGQAGTQVLSSPARVYDKLTIYQLIYLVEAHQVVVEGVEVAETRAEHLGHDGVVPVPRVDPEDELVRERVAEVTPGDAGHEVVDHIPLDLLGGVDVSAEHGLLVGAELFLVGALTQVEVVPEGIGRHLGGLTLFGDHRRGGFL